MRQISKEESSSRFNALGNFCDAMNLHFEPALRGTTSKLYHASNVLHTRIIDVNNSIHSIDPSDEKNIKLFLRTRNHDGYKLPHHLIKAEQFDMKLMGFVQAMKPTNFVTNRLGKIFVEKKRLYSRLTEDQITPYEYGVMMDELRQKELVTNNCYNSDDFLHYRFWFFDLDYEYDIPLPDLIETLKELNLFSFVTSIVKTSPTKYHIYIKSEMVATERHVDNWPLPLRLSLFEDAIDPHYIQKLCEKYPKKNGLDWYFVSLRGLPSIDRINSIPIPIPVEAKLSWDGRYVGDDKVYRDYLACHKEIATVLGADPSVSNETRNAQLVGYTNPKNGYTANLVYANKDAPVLTTLTAKTLIHGSITRYYNNYTYPFYIPRAVKKELSIKNIDNKHEILSFFKDQKVIVDTTAERYHIKSSKKAKTKFTKIPESPEAYCMVHALQDEVLWDKDITGNSNAMLNLFSRFAHAHIDLTDTKQQKTFFKNVLESYFKDRISKDLSKDVYLIDFFRRFQKNCFHNSKTLLSNKNNITSQITYTSEQLQETWSSLLINAVGEDHECIASKAHIRLRKIICDHAAKYGILISENGLKCLDYQIPASLLNDVHGYKQKLNFYSSLGLYSIGYSYRMPTRKGNVIIKSGQCKKHTLILKINDANVVEQINMTKKIKVKKVEEEKVEVEEVVETVVAEEAATLLVQEVKPIVDTMNPLPVTNINELEANPPLFRNLSLDYVMSVIHIKPELFKTSPTPFTYKKKEVAPSLGYEQHTISDLMQLITHKDNVYYKDMEENFNEIKNVFLGQDQQEIDHENDDYQIKRSKIFNNVRPLSKKEIQSLSNADRRAYLLTISDLIDLSGYSRRFVHEQNPLDVVDVKVKYVLDAIESQVVTKANFLRMELDRIKLFRWIKRDLQAHIWQCDFICTMKQKLHKEFLTTLDEDIEPLFRHSGSLFRDYNRKLSEGSTHGGYLSPHQAAEYATPVELSKEEAIYYRPIDSLVDQLKIIFYRVPYDHREKDSILELLNHRSSIIEKSLNNLKTIA